MAHTHSVYDTDSHFSVDPITRQITNLSSKKGILIKGDHNSERFTFEIPRMIEGHDMSECNMVQVHYTNISGTDRTKFSADVYEPDDFQISPDGDDVVICSWLISGTATEYVGSLNFCLRLACATGSEMDYVWVSAVHSGITVAESIDASGLIVEQYPDVLEKWYLELFNTGNMGVNAILAAQEQALSELEEKKDELYSDIDRALDSILAIDNKLLGNYTVRFVGAITSDISLAIYIDGNTYTAYNGDAFAAKSIILKGIAPYYVVGTTDSGERLEFVLEVADMVGDRYQYTLELTENVTFTYVSLERPPHNVTFAEECLINKNITILVDDGLFMANDVLGKSFLTRKVGFNYAPLEGFEVCGHTSDGQWTVFPVETVTLGGYALEVTEDITITFADVH